MDPRASLAWIGREAVCAAEGDMQKTPPPRARLLGKPVMGCASVGASHGLLALAYHHR
jgi:hypothetical protein